MEFVFRVFVPNDDSCECWMLSYKNNSNSNRNIKLYLSQIWSVARFGIHTAEEGIPYLTTPGQDFTASIVENGIIGESCNKELPVKINVFFSSPQTCTPAYETLTETRKDGRSFNFTKTQLTFESEVLPGEKKIVMAVSAADELKSTADVLFRKYSSSESFNTELNKVKQYKNKLIKHNTCSIPDKDMQNFLNIWFKHQLFLTYRYVRSGYIGYRDSLQDAWGYGLIEPESVRDKILRILSHMKKDGSCPRNFSPFEIDGEHDMRNFMDSGTWIGLTLSGYIKETGDTSILYEKIRYLDDDKTETVEMHVWKALDLLYEKRGRFGLCLVGTGDWNDGIEGISRKGPAVSVWLTMAVFHFQNLMSDLYKFLGEVQKVEKLDKRSAILKKNINRHAWDGQWYVYAFSGTGKPIGSHKNKEGRIHLNSNTWAIFTGIAGKERSKVVMRSIEKHLGTSLGPALLAPPYISEGDEVGRIAKLEPGTFENGSVYKHAVAFKVFADLENQDYEKAYRTFADILPTNPNNPDSRRTSEPYCLGNYYCGPSHERFGQNFFSWFTGSPAWLIRAGFEEILGVKADYKGLQILPKVPAHWNEFIVNRFFRGTEYNLKFERTQNGESGIWVDGNKIRGNVIKPAVKKVVSIIVKY
jgi:cellobiose phosphorylase